MLFAAGAVTTSTTSCAKKIGCSAENNVGPKTKRDGSLSSKRGKSGLFGKNGKKKKLGRNKL